MIDFFRHSPAGPFSRFSRRFLLPPVLLLTLAISLCFTRDCPADQGMLFPRYAEIEGAVKFWEAIYATHSLNSAVLHDREDLSRVYGVIQLLDRDLPAADKINTAAIQQGIEKYKNILEALAKGNPPGTMEEIRIAAMFTGTDHLSQMTEAAGRIRSQTGQKERFLEGISRSGAYMKAIKAILSQYGLPVELAYLPHVESSFNPKAYSKFGAAGVWQFTKATGQQYLQINETVDERRDPIIAAEAAAKYLKNSYMVLGSWPEAITAYNYGTAGMLRAQNSHGSYPAIYTGYSEGHFGFASRNFYAEFLAALEVATALEQDPSIPRDKAVAFTTYTLPGYIHVHDLKNHFKLSEKQIRQLNPALRDPVYAGQRLIPRRYQLRLPAERRTEQLISSVPRRMLSNSQMSESFYRVKRGDTAGAIASASNIPLKILLRANALDPDARIYVGQKLRIPSHPRLSPDEPLLPHLVADRTSSKRFSAAQEKKNDQIPVIKARRKRYPAQTPVASEAVAEGTILVHPDETLPLIAHWLKLDESSLRQLNNLQMTDTIQPGQQLKVLYPQTSAAQLADLRSDFAREVEADFFAAYQVVDQFTYHVQQGDTIWSLCNRKFHIPLWLLKKYNENMDYSTIRQFQKLLIPIVRER